MFLRHTIDYPDGTTVRGKLDHRGQPALLGLDVQNKRVLDIATNDGFFAFWAEQNGASEVVAIDVDTFDAMEWGHDGAPEGWDKLQQQDKASAFWMHHKKLKSRVIKKTKSVNELTVEDDGMFDVVINYGLLYHMRDPLHSLDVCRKITQGMMALETQIFPRYHNVPAAFFAGRFTKMLSITDYFWPTERCVCVWLRTADFPHVFAQKRETKALNFRQRFLACVSEEAAEAAAKNPNFRRVDDAELATNENDI